MHRSPRSVLAALALALAAGAAVAAATLSGPAAIKDRQAHMKAMGAATKALGEQLRSGAPDKAVVKAQADKIAAGAQALPQWFPPGSGPGPDVKTQARPLVWSDTAGFAAARDKLVKAAAGLTLAAAMPDQAGVGDAMKQVGAACKSCHERFKVPDKD